jgi:transitional endoplasmic reticulum ATPase
MRQLVILDGNAKGRSLVLEAGKSKIIGRDPACDWTITDESVSWHHCQVRCLGEEVFVRDLHSTNGSHIDNNRVTEQTLEQGQVLRLGDVTIALADLGPQSAEDFLKSVFLPWRAGIAFVKSASARRRLVRAITALMVGCGVAGVTGKLPFYPSEWRLLMILAVAALWFFQPVSSAAIALMGIGLTVAYHFPWGIAAAYLVIAVLLRPFSLLVLSALVLFLVEPDWAFLLPTVPLVAGLAGPSVGAGLAGLCCLVAELFLLGAGKARASVLAGVSSNEPLFQLQPGPVATLWDFSWITNHHPGPSDYWVSLGRPFAEHPLLIAQVLVWAGTGATVAWLMSRALKASPLPRASLAVGIGGCVLIVGHLLCGWIFPWTGFSAYIAVAESLFATLLVGFAAPLIVLIPSALSGADGTSIRSTAGGGGIQVKKELPADTWSDLVGISDIQEELRTALQTQFDPAMREEMRRMSVRPTRGVLLFGPPGTGKTKLARVLAHEASASFFAVSGTEFTSKWYGESEANLRQIFEDAREHKPAVLFFDELEAFLPRRTELSRSDAPEKGIVATFLSYTDGLADLDGVFLVGATNHPNLIDPAALRPGRFDKLIYLSAPDARARSLIFTRYLRNKPVVEDVDFTKLGDQTERFTGADIESVCKEAAMATLKQGSGWITMASLVSIIQGTKPSVTIPMQREYEEIAERYGRRSQRSAPVEVMAKTVQAWSDVVGLQSVKETLREAVEMPLLHADVLKNYGVKPTRGVLLFGPPGCGKTLLAKVIAQESQAHFLHVKGPELLREHTGQSEAGLRNLFVRARESVPCLLFFDELDALAGARGTVNASGTQILAQFLTEMEGVDELKGVVVLAATNRPEALDPALLRPGRFDRIIYVPPPDHEARRGLFAHELSAKPAASGIDFDELARITEGYSSVDIINLCNGAAYETAKEEIRSGTQQLITSDRLAQQIQRCPPSLTANQIQHYQQLRDALQR